MIGQMLHVDATRSHIAARRALIWSAVTLVAFGLGYLAGQGAHPDFQDQHARAAGPAIEEWHGNVMRSGR